jgi:hypothetical protein
MAAAKLLFTVLVIATIKTSTGCHADSSYLRTSCGGIFITLSSIRSAEGPSFVRATVDWLFQHSKDEQNNKALPV